MVSDATCDPPLRGEKSILICQRCGHESHVDGDWTRIRRGDLETVRCPTCQYEVAHRPRGTGEVPRRRCEPRP